MLIVAKVMEIKNPTRTQRRNVALGIVVLRSPLGCPDRRPKTKLIIRTKKIVKKFSNIL